MDMTDVEPDTFVDLLEIDELSHVLICNHWISPFVFDGQYSVDIRGHVTEIHQRINDPGQPTQWQAVQRGTELWNALSEAIERERRDTIRDAIAELEHERRRAKSGRGSWFW